MFFRYTKRETLMQKVRIYKKYCSVCPLVGIGTLPTPLSPASVPIPPDAGGAHSPAGEGLGESQFRRLEKSCTLPSLCSHALDWGRLFRGGWRYKKVSVQDIHRATANVPLSHLPPWQLCPHGTPSNVRFQNIRFQNVRVQNVRNVRFTKRQVYKTSGLQNARFTKRQVYKTSSLQNGRSSKRPVS